MSAAEQPTSITASLRNAFVKQPGFVQLIIVVVVLIIVYSLYKKLTKDVKSVKDKRLTSQEVEQLKKKGQKLSYGYTQYKNYAEQIYDATWDQGLGTDEETIKRVYRAMKNDLDVMQLEKAFGKRHYVGALYQLSGWLNFEEDQPLSVHLTREGMAEDINTILKKKGIKRRY